MVEQEQSGSFIMCYQSITVLKLSKEQNTVLGGVVLGIMTTLKYSIMQFQGLLGYIIEFNLDTFLFYSDIKTQAKEGVLM